MAWTELTRRQHDRVGDKYASDLTDAEWGGDRRLVAALQTNRQTPDNGSARGV